MTRNAVLWDSGCVVFQMEIVLKFSSRQKSQHANFSRCSLIRRLCTRRRRKSPKCRPQNTNGGMFF